MAPLWKSNFGRLFITGCGLQIGLLLTLISFVIALSFCLIFVLAGALGFSLAQEIAGPSRDTPVAVLPPAAPTSAEAARLLAEIDVLINQVDALQAEALVHPASAGTPLAIAHRAGAGLYSGPGLDYELVGNLSAGQSVEVVGRNITLDWWLVAMANERFGWVSGAAVDVTGAIDAISVVTVPSQLVQPAASDPLAMDFTPTLTPTLPPRPTPTPTPPPGTPTPGVAVDRHFVEELPAYQKVKRSLLTPPVSASISPDGQQIAITERIKLYTIGVAGAHTDIWLEDNEQLGPIGWVVWSPDGQHLAFVVGFKTPTCQPCESVAILSLADGSMTFLKPPDNLNTDAPRWTQDGRLLVNVHPGEPADGLAYIYDAYGQGQEAAGVYLLSASHEGQKWFPWQPGRIWRAGVTERPDSYVHD